MVLLFYFSGAGRQIGRKPAMLRHEKETAMRGAAFQIPMGLTGVSQVIDCADARR